MRSSTITSSKAVPWFTMSTAPSLTTAPEPRSPSGLVLLRLGLTLLDGQETHRARPTRRKATRRTTGGSGVLVACRVQRRITTMDSITDTVDTAIVTITNTPSHTVQTQDNKLHCVQKKTHLCFCEIFPSYSVKMRTMRPKNKIPGVAQVCAWVAAVTGHTPYPRT